MKCFPGKTPVNGFCLPLLRESTNLSYALSAEFTFEISETNCSRVADRVLRFLRIRCFKDLINSVVNGTKLHALAHAVYLKPCKNSSTFLDDISGVFAVHVFANQSVRRFELENYLYQLMNNDCILKSGNKLRMIREVNFEMPIPNMTLNSHCASIEATEDTNLMHNRVKYKPIPVSKILFCNQIVLNPKEFQTLAKISACPLQAGRWNIQDLCRRYPAPIQYRRHCAGTAYSSLVHNVRRECYVDSFIVVDHFNIYQGKDITNPSRKKQHDIVRVFNYDSLYPSVESSWNLH